MDINMLIRKVGLNNLSQMEYTTHGFRSMKMVFGLEITFKWIEEIIEFINDKIFEYVIDNEHEIFGELEDMQVISNEDYLKD